MLAFINADFNLLSVTLELAHWHAVPIQIVFNTGHYLLMHEKTNKGMNMYITCLI